MADDGWLVVPSRRVEERKGKEVAEAWLSQRMLMKCTRIPLKKHIFLGGVNYGNKKKKTIKNNTKHRYNNIANNKSNIKTNSTTITTLTTTIATVKKQQQ